jgi:putative spermidine/putrescine transport system permease protein
MSATLTSTPPTRRTPFPTLPFKVALPAVFFLFSMLVLPLLYNLQRSLTFEQTGEGYYRKLFLDPFYLGISFNTIALSAAVTFVCLIFGYPIAYYIARVAGRWQGFIIFLLVAPLLTSIIMRTFGWRVLLARRGLVNNILLDLGIIDAPLRMTDGPVIVVVGLVHLMIPFMVLSISAVLQAQNKNLEESARILGAGRATVFLKITLPLSMDGVATGTILVFMLTLGSFVTLQLLGGGAFQTLPLLIYQQFHATQDLAFATALSNVLVAIALITLYLQLRLIRRRGAD